MELSSDHPALRASHKGRELLSTNYEDDYSYASENELDDDRMLGDGHDDEEDGDQDLTQMSSSTQATQKVVRDKVQLIDTLRLIVILTFLTFAFIAAETIFAVTSMNQINTFRQELESISTQLGSTLFKRTDQMLWTAQTFAGEIQVATRSQNWPMVVLPDFPQRCQGPLYLTKASTITFSPKITPQNQVFWQLFASSMYKNITIDDSINGFDVDEVKYFPTERTIQEGIYKFDSGVTSSVTPRNGESNMFPIWQMSPRPPPNQDDENTVVGTFFEETTNAVRGQALQMMLDSSGSVVSNFLFQDTNSSDLAIYGDPRSNLYTPILDDDDDETVVGSLGFQFHWDRLFEDALNNAWDDPVVVVLESSCGGVFSYEVQGENSTFLGEGDLHDTSIQDYTPMSTTFEDYASLFVEHGNAMSDGEGSCLYRITTYPTVEFQESYVTNKPEIMRWIVLGILFFIIIVFCAFDRVMHRHQSSVVEASKKSDAIVRSLFPDEVADKLYEAAEKKKNKNNSSEDVGQETIADNFPEVTIMFADIAGFTAWSSEREPVQVFQLLENIYNTMDKIAKKLDVFKVETVGDCYVCATGLPQPQADHFIRMCHFARATVHKVSRLTRALEEQLGPGTAELGMRVGIHSGSVTAGVLRGQKARFQLFGDTMNMSARIESSGEKNRVHLSSATAALLRDVGLEHWLMEREDKVSLKGKGTDITTYWLKQGAIASSLVSSICSSTDASIVQQQHHQNHNSSDKEDLLAHHPHEHPRRRTRPNDANDSHAELGIETMNATVSTEEGLEHSVDWTGPTSSSGSSSSSGNSHLEVLAGPEDEHDGGGVETRVETSLTYDLDSQNEQRTNPMLEC